LRLILLAGGLPRPVSQYEVRTASGLFVARLDLAYPKRAAGLWLDRARFAARDLREPARLIATVKAALRGVSG
jgi:hypothetical protein